VRRGERDGEVLEYLTCGAMEDAIEGGGSIDDNEPGARVVSEEVWSSET
jgi:hypothetical protein